MLLTVSLPVHGGTKDVIGAEGFERHADREQLAHRGDQPRAAGIDVVDDAAAVEIDDAQGPAPLR